MRKNFLDNPDVSEAFILQESSLLHPQNLEDSSLCGEEEFIQTGEFCFENMNIEENEKRDEIMIENQIENVIPVDDEYSELLNFYDQMKKLH